MPPEPNARNVTWQNITGVEFRLLLWTATDRRTIGIPSLLQTLKFCLHNSENWSNLWIYNYGCDNIVFKFNGGFWLFFWKLLSLLLLLLIFVVITEVLTPLVLATQPRLLSVNLTGNLIREVKFNSHKIILIWKLHLFKVYRALYGFLFKTPLPVFPFTPLMSCCWSFKKIYPSTFIVINKIS